jgi:hypothetical protein
MAELTTTEPLVNLPNSTLRPPISRPKGPVYEPGLLSVGEIMMRKICRAVARGTQSDERALRVAFFAVIVSAVAAVMLEKVLS